MKAMILAAGLGTRLRPLTFIRPKVLVPVMGTNLLEFWIWRLHHAGCEAVIVNAFHLSEELISVSQEGKYPIPVHVQVEPILLGTGGGISNALSLLGEDPFIVVNGDIICRTSLKGLYEKHLASGRPVSLVMHDHPPFNNVAVSDDGDIVEFEREAARMAERRQDVRLMAFTGIHFIHPEIMKSLEPGAPAEIIPLYRQLIQEGVFPRALFDADLYWREIGSVEAYRALHNELGRLPANFIAPIPTGNGIFIHSEARVAQDVVLTGFVAIGKGSRVSSRAQLENVILWDHVHVGPNARLRNCIACDGAVVNGTNVDRILTEGKA